MALQNSEPPMPPGVISSIKEGFDAVASNIVVILPPFLLDLFLWLGPRLSVNQLFLKARPDLVNFFVLGGVPKEELKNTMDMLDLLMSQTNLFWILRSLPIGVSSLLARNFDPLLQKGAELTFTTPLGSQTVWQVSSDLTLFGLNILLVLAAWLLGAIYYRSVTSLVLASDHGMLLGFGRAITQTMLFSVVWSVASWMIGIPLVLILSLLAGLSPLITQIVFFVGVFFSVWLVVPIFFSLHGIFVMRQNAFLSIWSALRMSRFTMPNSSLFVMSTFLLGFMLNFLWRIAPLNSWATLVGIFGHAFVTTALLAASFVFYRDSLIWIQVMLDRLKSSPVLNSK
jgi:hypothetical protein